MNLMQVKRNNYYVNATPVFEVLTEDEIERAKRYMKGLYKLSLQYRNTIASSYNSALLLNLPLERFTDYEDKLELVNVDVVKEHLERLNDDLYSLAIVR
jgi:predicted Zn-dependent peptidase